MSVAWSSAAAARRRPRCRRRGRRRSSYIVSAAARSGRRRTRATRASALRARCGEDVAAGPALRTATARARRRCGATPPSRRAGRSRPRRARVSRRRASCRCLPSSSGSVDAVAVASASARAAPTSARWENACGKLPTIRPSRRVVLLGRAGRRRWPGPTSRSHQRAWRRRAARPRRRPSTSQNEQARNGCSSPGEAVDAGLGAVAQQQPVAHQVLLDGRDRAEHPRVVAVDEADGGEHQQRRVDLGGVVVLGEGVALGVEALRQDLVAHLRRAARATARPGPSSPCSSTAADGAVEGRPHHHPRVGEVPQRAADLPQPVVGLVPVLGEVVDQRALQGPGVVGLVERRRARACSRAIITSPSTSVCRWSTAPLPIRTGRDAGVPGQVVERRARGGRGRRRRRT